MHITVFIYDGFTALDAVGPYEVLSRLPGATTVFAGVDAGPVTTDNGVLQLVAETALRDVEQTDLLLVPGGPASRDLGAEEAVGTELRRLAASAKIVASVCTGALILGGAGLLKGKRSVTHWAFMDALESFGAAPVNERIVVDGTYYAAAGVSAGIDMALRLAADLSDDFVAQAIQLGIEYDPQPPFDAGSTAKAGPEVVERVIEYAQSRV
jgi:putative intracellular protease/amidase